MVSKTFSKIRNWGEYSSKIKAFSIVAGTTRLILMPLRNCELWRKREFPVWRTRQCSSVVWGVEIHVAKASNFRQLGCSLPEEYWTSALYAGGRATRCPEPVEGFLCQAFWRLPIVTLSLSKRARGRSKESGNDFILCKWIEQTDF